MQFIDELLLLVQMINDLNLQLLIYNVEEMKMQL